LKPLFVAADIWFAVQKVFMLLLSTGTDLSPVKKMGFGLLLSGSGNCGSSELDAGREELKPDLVRYCSSIMAAIAPLVTALANSSGSFCGNPK
jgi:hypothetical protein